MTPAQIDRIRDVLTRALPALDRAATSEARGNLVLTGLTKLTTAQQLAADARAILKEIS